MGLQEKQWKRSIEEQYVVEFKQDIKSILDADLDVTFDWDSFDSAKEIMYVPTYALDRVKSAFRELANDQDAKEEIVAQIKTLHIKNINDNAEEAKNMRIGDGVSHSKSVSAATTPVSLTTQLSASTWKITSDHLSRV